MPTPRDGGGSILTQNKTPGFRLTQGGSPTSGGLGCGSLHSSITSAETTPGRNAMPTMASEADLRLAQAEDPLLLAIGACLREGHTKDPKGHGEWRGVLRQHRRNLKIVDNVVGVKDGGAVRVSVPKKLRMDIMRIAHSPPCSDHIDRERTAQRVQQRFIWPGIGREIRAFCRSCVLCQRRDVSGPRMRAQVDRPSATKEAHDRARSSMTHAAAAATCRYNAAGRVGNCRRGDKVWVRDFQAAAGGKPKLGVKYKEPWTLPGTPWSQAGCRRG